MAGRPRKRKNYGLGHSPGSTGMGAPRRVTDEERARVVELHNLGESRNSIAKTLGRSTHTITRILRDTGADLGPGPAKATAAFVSQAKYKRARLADLMLDDALELRKRLYQEAPVHVVTKDGVEEYVYQQPPLRDIRDLMAAVTLAAKAHADLVKMDDDTRSESAKSMLVDLAEALGVPVGSGD